MDTPAHDEVLKGYSKELEPDQVLPSKWKWIWSWIGLALLFMVLGAGILAGTTRMLSEHWPPVSAPTSAANVSISESVDEMALLLISTSESSSEIKVTNFATNSNWVKTMAQGNFRSLAAALSPHKDRLVYIREEEGHRNAIVIDLASSNSVSVDKDRLRIAASGASIEPCSWSSVAWSPNGKRFCFFGCGKDASVLVVVEAETELSPIVIKNTRSGQSTARQVSWINSDNLLYTYTDASTQQSQISRTEVGSDRVPISVYK